MESPPAGASMVEMGRLIGEALGRIREGNNEILAMLREQDAQLDRIDQRLDSIDGSLHRLEDWQASQSDKLDWIIEKLRSGGA